MKAGEEEGEKKTGEYVISVIQYNYPPRSLT